MYDWELYGIVGVILLVLLAGAASLFLSKNGPLGRRAQQQVRELETKIRMDTGELLVQDLRAIAPLYLRLHKNWEAEQALQRALSITKQEWGEQSPLVIAILKDFVRIMSLSNQTAQVKFYKSEIRKLESQGR